MNCLSCNAVTSNGLALCDLCHRAAATCLEYVPVYFTNLARWRPGRAGSRPVPSSREPQGAFAAGTTHGDRVSRALDETGADLALWATKLEERGITVPTADGEAEQIEATCRAINTNLHTIATADWAGTLVHSLRGIAEWLGALTIRVAPGWYAGGCQRCDSGTYVIPGLTYVTCGGCGVVTYARDHLDTVLNEARGWVDRPMRIAEAVVALVDTEMSVPRLHKRISKWGERDQIETVRKLDDDGDPTGPKRYRLGDVLDRIHSEGATRLDQGVPKSGKVA